MPGTRTTYDALLKDYYEDPIRETLNNEIFLFSKLEKSDREWSGRRVIFPVHVGRAAGAIGARAEGGTLPSASNQNHTQSVITATFQYATLEITGPVMASTKHAFGEALAMELDGLMTDFRKDLARQTYGEGRGILAQVGISAASASTIQVLNQNFEPGQPGARYLQVGDRIEGGSITDGDADFGDNQVINVALATALSSQTDTITVSSTVTITSSEGFLFREGNSLLEIVGLRGHIDDFAVSNLWGATGFLSAVQTISRSANLNWNATVLGNSGTARLMDGNLVQQAMDQIAIKSGKKPAFGVGHHDVLRAFLDSVAGDRRYTSPVFDVGMSKLTYNGTDLYADLEAPYNELFLLSDGTVKLYTMKDFHFADDDGAVLRNIQVTDQFRAFIRWFGQLGLENPRGACVIRDIRTNL